MLKRVLCSTFLLFVFIINASAEIIEKETYSEKKNRLELGAGVLTLRMNHYRGSDQYKNYYLPLPYISYSSNKIEAETSFIRGILYQNSLFAIKLSLMFGLSVESEDNHARAGMPDIGYIFETGPMIVFNLWESQNGLHKFSFEAPFRQVFETDLQSVQRVGLFSVPYVKYRIMPNPYTFNWQIELSTAIMFGNNNYHDFFYSVEKRYETPTRSSYNSKGGYSGTQFTLLANKKFTNIRLITLFRYDNLSKTAFVNSPLIKRKYYFVFGLGAFYVF